MIHNLKLLKPTGSRVLIEKPKPEAKTTASGIILDLPDKLVENNHTQQIVEKEIEDEHNVYVGIVLAVGPEVKDIKPQDRVCLGKYSGAEVEKNSRIYIVNVADIVATI